MPVHVRRLLAATVSLWFALYFAAPQWLHPCPSHSAPVGGAAAQEDAAHAAHHGAHAAPAPTSKQGGDAPEGDCCCPGPQCGTSAVLAAAASVPAALVADQGSGAPSRAAQIARERAAFLLPYATPPPASIA